MRLGGCHWSAGVMMKRALLVILMIALLSQQTASSFVPPAAGNWLFNRSIASIMREVAKRRGVAASDPRLAATEAAMSSQLTALNVAATGAGIGLTMLGAPVWLTVLAGLGIVAAGSAVVAYMQSDEPTSGERSIQIGQDGYGRVSVTVPSEQQTSVEQASYPGLIGSGFADYWGVAAVAAGFRVYRRSGCVPTAPCSRFPKGGGMASFGDTAVDLSSLSEVKRFVMFMSHHFDGDRAFRTVELRPERDMDGNVLRVMVDYTIDVVDWQYLPCDPKAPNGPKCPTQSKKTINESRDIFAFGASGKWGGMRLGGVERLYEREYPSTAQNWYDSLERAYIGVPKDIQGARIGSETLAKIVDSAWRQAASRPDYEGLPYSTVDPVTTADVEPWAKANPEAVPRIEDLFRPASLPQERKVVIREKIKPETSTETETETVVEPTTDPGTGSKIRPDTKTPSDPQLVKDVNVINRPTVDVGNPVKVDLGTAPLVATPTLEEPPTAAMILDPILKMLPGFTDWKTPKYSAECPRPTFELFDKRIRMDAMCDLAEKYRPMITSIMLAVFVLIAATIVLAA
ncbi:hypothetical protein C266_17506 [Pandoraea sp. SD6-2]|nr:hypothetical protein C266_17506 [Pandoraea sp. SD6-2]